MSEETKTELQSPELAEASRKWERQSLSWAAVMLCALLGMWGCLAIYSTQIAALNDWDFLRRQIVFLLVGLPVLVCCWRISFRSYREFSPFLALLAIFGLVSVLRWGTPVNGMSGWFEPFPGIQVQPSEFAKPFFLLALLVVWNKSGKLGEWRACLLTAVAGLCFIVVFASTLAIFIFITGCGAWKLVCGGVGALALAAAAAAWRWEAVSARLSALTAGADPLSTGWHVRQFQLAIARGGLSGSKLGHTVWTENYLPLAHNDSIFAAMSETLGFLGTIPLILMLVALVAVLVKLAFRCSSQGNRVFVAGAAFMIAVQSLLHVSVNATLIPPTGLTLPLISYGGSSLISTMILVGMALSAAAESRD